jgi:hypothetical protein
MPQTASDKPDCWQKNSSEPFYARAALPRYAGTNVSAINVSIVVGVVFLDERVSLGFM